VLIIDFQNIKKTLVRIKRNKMLIDDIVAKIDEGGPRSYYSFETFILNLLKFHIESQDKPFSITSDPRGVGDATALEGFDEYGGKTLIEVKFNLDRMPPRHLIERILFRPSKLEQFQNFNNLIIISAKPIREKWIERFTSELSILELPVNVILLGPESINKIVNKHRKKANEIVKNLFSLRLESAVTKQKGDWKKEREDRIEQIKEYYSKGQFSLFLGAGVSSSAGMPDWTTLLNSLFVTYLTQEFDDEGAIKDEDIEEIVTRLNKVDEPSALMAARYLRKGMSKDKNELHDFTNAISKNLYKLRNKERSIDSELIKSLVDLCIPRRTGAKVKSVVTYNFDDLIERELDNKSIQSHSIYTDNETYDPDELPIYHVHGFLPEDSSKYDSLDQSTLVFSEEGYHQIYSDSYHWSNLVQLNNLREYHCLMVGLSMTDPNLRRLLDISGTNMEKAKHFAFIKRLSMDDFCYEKSKNGEDRKQVITNLKGAEKFLDRHHNLNEEIMKELGVSIIWYTDYDEIPTTIKEIKNY
jgi:hypothetical protein